MVDLMKNYNENFLRLAESNMIGISREIEKFYNSNSRNDVNRSLADLLESSLVHKTALIPSRLIMEHCMLVAILSGNIGTEVGAFMLQHVVGKFNDEFIKLNERKEESLERDVAIDNLLGDYRTLALYCLMSLLQ